MTLKGPEIGHNHSYFIGKHSKYDHCPICRSGDLKVRRILEKLNPHGMKDYDDGHDCETEIPIKSKKPRIEHNRI